MEKGISIMDTEKRLGIKKGKAFLLFIQMLFIILLLFVAIYLLIFTISNQLGPWMITSYIFITISVLSIWGYGIIGYKKGTFAYMMSIAPFLGAVFVNILLPQRNTFQIALLTILFTLLFGFMIKQKEPRFAYVFLILMVVVSLTFSIYSSITANTQFLGSISENWLTYLAMYLSIFVPTIMSITFTVVYNVRLTKQNQEK